MTKSTHSSTIEKSLPAQGRLLLSHHTFFAASASRWRSSSSSSLSSSARSASGCLREQNIASPNEKKRYFISTAVL
nr:MAG TPA: hypothetical protein [Caudoviricetes sp.]